MNADFCIITCVYNNGNMNRYRAYESLGLEDSLAVLFRSRNTIFLDTHQPVYQTADGETKSMIAVIGWVNI